MAVFERFQPAPSGYTRALRLTGAIGLLGGIINIYQISTHRFLGLRENSREVEMDMREMVGKAKRGEPLYGVSSLTPYMQGVAARNSRNAVFFSHVIFWPNMVNHDQVRMRGFGALLSCKSGMSSGIGLLTWVTAWI